MGDGTNLVLALAGELLAQAGSLIQMGLHPSEIVGGFTRAGAKALEVLETLTAMKVEDMRDVAAVTKVLKPVIASKQYGYEDVLAPLVVAACIQVRIIVMKKSMSDVCGCLGVPSEHEELQRR